MTTIPTDSPELNRWLDVDCPQCGAAAASWCNIEVRPPMAGAICAGRRAFAEARKDLMRRIRCAHLFLQTSRQTAVQRAGAEIVSQLVYEAMDALMGKYPDWVTEEWHQEIERDALAWQAKLVELATNPRVTVKEG